MFNIENYLKTKQESDLKLLKIAESNIHQNNIEGFLSFGTLIGAKRHKGFIPWDDDVDFAIMLKDRDKLTKVFNDYINDNDNNLFFQNGDGTNLNLFEPSYFGYKNEIRYIDSYIKRINPITIHNKIDFFYMAYLNSEELNEFHKLFKEYNIMSTALRSKTTSFPKKIIFNLIKLKYNSLKKKIERFESSIKDNDSKNRSLYFWNTLNPTLYIKKLPNLENLEKCDFEDTTVLVPTNSDEFLTTLYGDWMTLPPLDQQVNVHSVTHYNIDKDIININNYEYGELDIEVIFSNEQFVTILTKNIFKFESDINYDVYKYNDGMKIIISNNSEDFYIKSKNNFISSKSFYNGINITIESSAEIINFKYKK